MDVSSVDERFGALKFSLFAEDNKITKSFVLRASESFHICLDTSRLVPRRIWCTSSARSSGFLAFFMKTVKKERFQANS